ncbi:MAG: triose-phosphate isomerase [Bacilli bacterium]|nr:triose-phosphate isomerase [Bacilli bacterium]
MKRVVVLNHKSYLKHNDIKSYPIEINDYIRSDQTVIICPSSLYIPYFKGKYNFKLGSQNIEYENITGEITGSVLKSMEVRYTLIGTNDRKNTKEENINKKIKEALNNNIRPIVVVGETYYEKELKKTANVINQQINDYFKGIDVKQDIIICYSPNWSYTGKQIPTNEYISEAVELIKNIIKRKYNENIKVIYGGNITFNNVKELDKIKAIDGYLIGKISTNINEIKKLLNTME